MPKYHTDEQPNRNEEEYFAKQNAELIKEMRARLDVDREQRERKQHFMKCPKCGADLVERQHGSVSVDECPDCRGFWLDAGELDLIQHITKNPVSRFMDDFIQLFSHRAPPK